MASTSVRGTRLAAVAALMTMFVLTPAARARDAAVCTWGGTVANATGWVSVPTGIR